jgi:hypothetical protein
MSRPLRVLATISFALLALFALLPSGPSVVDAAKPPTRTPVPPGPTPTPPPPPGGLRAGLRASDYGISPFPSPSWWVDSIGSMASRFPGSTGEQVAVVVETFGKAGKGGCWAHFPNPSPGTSWPNVVFDDADLFESTFDAFDANSIRVWLQVEPAQCDVPMLVDLVMQRYGSHSSVIGFGVDVEWYRKDVARDGKAVTDAEAAAWVAKTRTYDPAYLVFVKHWLTEKMPPTHRDGLVFIDDSQGHGSLEAMVNEFGTWGETFAPSPVGFQYGYASDRKWWSKLADPPRTVGNALLARIPNTRDLLWVDFTAYQIWPPQ